MINRFPGTSIPSKSLFQPPGFSQFLASCAQLVKAQISLVVLAGICWGIKLYIREKDPRWQAAKEIYLVQTALQKVDENAKLESLSEVRSFEITSPNSPTIYYYCTITSYLTEAPNETTALNKTALSMVVDIDSLENRRDCKVGNQNAVMGEIDGFHYLCWTYSPKYSCVFKYVEGSVTEEDLFHMAESVAPIK